MFSTLLQLMRTVIGAIRLADVIDVVVVSMFVYAAITWVRRARSRFVLLGFASLVAVYFLARVLDMYLTLFLFQAGITVALLALVVIFQEEIRRAFERIATGGLFRAGRQPQLNVPDSVDVLVEAASAMARLRIGALIAIRGKEPLERHTTGGILLEGRLSEALLYSIFDPSSAGHDGAVIVDKGHVSRFAVHLPLSTRIKEGARFGTRHTAALGLSERSDALVIVVSEERGTISVARAGTLEQLDSAAELKPRLSQFFTEVAPARKRNLWQRLFAQNLGTKLLSVALASVAWLLVFGQESETVARTFNVPVVYRDVPDGWLLDDPNPMEVRVTISAKSRSFELVDAKALRFSLDGASIRAGHQSVKLTPSQLELPRGFTVHEIDPESVSFAAHQTIGVEVPVRPQLVGKPPEGLRLKSSQVQPAKVRVMLARRERGRLTSLRTEAVDLSDVSASTSLTRGLVLPKGSRLARGEPTEVQVGIELEPDSAPK